MVDAREKLLVMWERIGETLRRVYGAQTDDAWFLAPVSEDRIAEVERILGTRLPDDYRASLTIHEGVKQPVWLWDAVSLLELRLVLDDHERLFAEAIHPSMKGVHLTTVGLVRGVLFDRSWIPIASDNGIPICLDMNPPLGGSVGQVIYVDWEDGTVRVIAKNFLEFIESGLRRMSPN